MTALQHHDLIVTILSVIKTGIPWESEKLHYPAEEIIKAVLTINGMKKKIDANDVRGNGEGYSTNGWQSDWWQEFIYKGKHYTLGGSGYHGGHSFNLSDE